MRDLEFMLYVMRWYTRYHSRYLSAELISVIRPFIACFSVVRPPRPLLLASVRRCLVKPPGDAALLT